MTSTHRATRAMVLGVDVRAVEVDSASQGIADSGANIGVTSYDVVRFYNRPIMRFVHKLAIHGVGDATLESTHFADFGPVLGKFALLPGTNVSTLISISNITSRGFSVEYSSGGVTIMRDGASIVGGVYDDQSRLWYLDLGELLLLPDGDSPLLGGDKDQHLRRKRDSLGDEWENFTSACSVLSSFDREDDQSQTTELVSKAPRKSRRGSVIPAWLVEAVFDLHNRLGHPSAKDGYGNRPLHVEGGSSRDHGCCRQQSVPKKTLPSLRNWKDEALGGPCRVGSR